MDFLAISGCDTSPYDIDLDPATLRKTSVIDTTGCQFRFLQGFCPRPCRGNLRCSPRPYSCIQTGRLLRRGGGERKGEWLGKARKQKGKTREGKEVGGDTDDDYSFVCQLHRDADVVNTACNCSNYWPLQCVNNVSYVYELTSTCSC